MSIIILAGKKQSGKSTVAKHLVQKYGYKELALATNLKKACVKLVKFFYDTKIKLKEFNRPSKDYDGVSLKHLFDEYDGISVRFVERVERVKKVQKTDGFTYRELLQYVGTDILRNLFGNDIHTLAMLKNIIPGEKYIISDCRFQDEIDTIASYCKLSKIKMTVLYINRAKEMDVFFEKDQHISEKLDIKTINHKIYNSSTLEVLYSQVDKIMIDF